MMRYCPDCEVSHDPMVSCETIDELRFPSSEMDAARAEHVVQQAIEMHPMVLCQKCGNEFPFGLLDDDGICDDCRMSLDEQLAASLNVVWPVLNGVCGHTLAKRENFRTGLEKWCDECHAWVAVQSVVVVGVTNYERAFIDDETGDTSLVEYDRRGEGEQ